MAKCNLEFLSLKGGCIGSSESTLVKMPHRWKSHIVDRNVTLIEQVHSYMGIKLYHN